jgi:hypothetical protein
MKIKQKRNLKKAEKLAKKVWEFKSEIISEYSNFDNKMLQSVNQKNGAYGVIDFLIRFALPNEVFVFEGKTIRLVEFIDSLTKRDILIIKKMKSVTGYANFNLNYDMWDGFLRTYRKGSF